MGWCRVILIAFVATFCLVQLTLAVSFRPLTRGRGKLSKAHGACSESSQCPVGYRCKENFCITDKTKAASSYPYPPPTTYWAPTSPASPPAEQ